SASDSIDHRCCDELQRFAVVAYGPSLGRCDRADHGHARRSGAAGDLQGHGEQRCGFDIVRLDHQRSCGAATATEWVVLPEPTDVYGRYADYAVAPSGHWHRHEL